MILECLNDIVGITNNSCHCLVGSLSNQQIQVLQASKSGLYTDDLEGGLHLKSLNDIDVCKTFYDLAIGAKASAIQRASNDIVLMLNQKFGKNKDVFSGGIGTRTFTMPFAMSKRYGGLRLSARELSDGVITLKGIELAFSSTTNVDVQIIRAKVGAETGEVMQTITIPTQSLAFGNYTLPTPLVLPLRIGSYAYEYYFVFDKSLYGGALPMNNQCMCNCGTLEKTLKSYVFVDGVGMDNLNTLQSKYLDSVGYGLVLNADIRCNSQAFLCREYDENDAVSITIAHAVLYKTGEFIIEEVLKSPEVNRITMMAREYLWGKRNHFRAEYEARIKYLASDSVIDIYKTDCFICKNDEIFYSGILA